MCFQEEGWRLYGCLTDLYFLPIICVLGLALNAACVLVFLSHRNHPLVPSLLMLSISDLCQLLLSIFVLFIPALHDFTDSEEFGVLGQMAYISTGALSPLLLAFNCASIWTICYISIQRHQAILRPLSNIYNTPSFFPIIIISVAALGFNASKWAEFRWVWIQVENDTRWFLAHEPSVLAMDASYRQLFDHLLYPVMVYLIPLLLLSLLNWRILSSIAKHRVNFDHKGRLAQERRSVALLISIVILFFLCHTGGLVIRFLDERLVDTDLFVFIKDFINLLFNINSFANPMLYFFFTRQFRDIRDSIFNASGVGSLRNYSPSSRSASLANVIAHLHALVMHQHYVGVVMQHHHHQQCANHHHHHDAHEHEALNQCYSCQQHQNGHHHHPRHCLPYTQSFEEPLSRRWQPCPQHRTCAKMSSAGSAMALAMRQSNASNGAAPARTHMKSRYQHLHTSPVRFSF